MLQAKVDAQYAKPVIELKLTMLATLDFFKLQGVMSQKSLILTYSTCIWRFCWHQKTRVPRTELSCGIVCMILRLAVSVEHRLVTD